MQLASSNPILADGALAPVLSQVDATAGKCTVAGVINKTAGCVLLAAVSGAIAVPVAKSYPGAMWIALIVSLIVSIMSVFMVRQSPRMAASITVVYSVAQGFLLGAFGMILEEILKASGKGVIGGIALQAFVIVVALMGAMLLLYRTGILRGGSMFRSVLSVLTLGIALTYLIAFVMGICGAQMPYLSLGSATGGGNAALIGLGINAVVLIVAALWMIIDFRQIEEAVAAGAPAGVEWYLAFGLVVTLAWVYLEALKLVFRLAMIFGNRR